MIASNVTKVQFNWTFITIDFDANVDAATPGKAALQSPFRERRDKNRM